MTDSGEIEGLLARVSAATGPSQELNALVICALLAPAGSKIEKSKWNGNWCIYEPRSYGKEPWALWEKPRGFSLDYQDVTSSIDAALALIERVLPGASPSVGMNVHHKTCGAFVSVLDDDGEPLALGWATAAKPALALLSALLKALNPTAAQPGMGEQTP